jgi:hypothetical protein
MSAVPTLTADLIIFSINSAIKLSNNLRRAYALSVRSKTLVLPLPDFDKELQTGTIINYFDSHPEYLSRLEYLAELHQKASNYNLTKEEEAEYTRYYLHLFEGESGLLDKKSSELSETDLLALFQIRQWEKGKAPGTALQMVAGTLVEIGIDYFAHAPGALNPQSTQGRVLGAFLNAFDDIPLADNPHIQRDFSNILIPRLFAAAAESVADLSPKFADDEKVQSFIRAAAKGIAGDIYARAGQLNALQKEEAVQWGQLVLRSLINHAGQQVLASPKTFFGTNDATSQVIQSSGLVLLDAILGDDPDKLDFRKALSPDSLDRLVGATLGVLAEHPDLLSGDQNIKAILSGVFGAIKEQSILDKGYLPELARMILEQSAGRLNQLSRESPNGQGKEHLLIVAAGFVLGALSEKPDSGAWKPVLSQRQVVDITENLLFEVAQNPAWVLDMVEGHPLIARVLDAAFGALRTLPPDERLSADTLRNILRLCLDTALISPQVLDKLKWGSEVEETVVLKKALDLAFACVFRPEVPAVSRLQLLADLLNYTTGVVLRQYPDKKGLVLLDLVLFNGGVDYSRGFDAQLTDQVFHAALEAMSKRPELLAKPEALQHILAGIAGALKDKNVHQPGLATTLVRLVLHHTGQNAQLIIGAGENEPKHLLVTALKQLLTALTATDRGGGWKPGVSPAQAEHLLESLLDALVRHPFWLTEKVQADSLLTNVLQTVFQALEKIPESERLSEATIQILLERVLRLVAASPQVLGKVQFADDAQEKEIFQRALELIFAYIFDNSINQAKKVSMLKQLTEFIFDAILSKYPDKRGLILIDLILFDNNGLNISWGFPEAQALQFADAALKALEQHPELITNDQILRYTITNVAGALAASNMGRQDLLPKLVQSALENTAEQIGPLLDTGPRNSRHLFSMVAMQLLNALAQPAEEGKWKPQLSDGQIIELLDLIYESSLKNPQWTLQGSYLFDVLHAIFLSLQQTGEPYTISFPLIKQLTTKVIESVNLQWELLTEIPIPSGEKILRIKLALDALIATLYGEHTDEKMAWYLSQEHIANLLIDYYLLQIAHTTASTEDINAVRNRLRNALETWKQNFSRDLPEILQNAA